MKKGLVRSCLPSANEVTFWLHGEEKEEEEEEIPVRSSENSIRRYGINTGLTVATKMALLDVVDNQG